MMDIKKEGKKERREEREIKWKYIRWNEEREREEEGKRYESM